MERGNKRPDLILCSDLHLREGKPTCWIDEDKFQKEQWLSVDFVSGLQIKYECPVIHTGDLFDHWKPSPWLLSMTIKYLPQSFYTIYGQHDLPQHNWELRNKSGIYTLEKANKVHVLPFCHWGQTPEEWKDYESSINLGGPKVLAWHHLTYMTPPFPGAVGGQADGLLRKYSQFDLIVTGDNHQSFSTEYKGRLLVNPGSLTRQDADQIDFKPRVALWYAETNTIKWVYIPIEEGVISREHIEIREERKRRISAFVSRLDSKWKVGVSFENNLKEFFNKNEIDPDVKQIIYNSYGKD